MNAGELIAVWNKVREAIPEARVQVKIEREYGHAYSWCEHAEHKFKWIIYAWVGSSLFSSGLHDIDAAIKDIREQIAAKKGERRVTV